MLDRRRRRATQAASAIINDDAGNDFAAVGVAPRRNSDRVTRNESWMTRVSHAVHYSIFSGKRLSGSKSTQVMPILPPSRICYDQSTNSLKRDTVIPILSKSALRHTASESAFRPSTQPSELHTNQVVHLDPVLVDSSLNRQHVLRSAVDNNHAYCVQTDNHNGSFGGEESSLVKTIVVGEHDAMIPPDNVHADFGRAAPVLRNFFSRDVSSVARQRQQERETRRDARYRANLKRQAKFREEHAKQQSLELKQQRQIRAAQLKAQNRQRRARLLVEAACARNELMARNMTQQRAFEAESVQWDAVIEQEMRALGDAYRKATRVFDR